MSGEQEPQTYPPGTNALKTLADRVYMHRLPSYGNKIFYGLGFLALTCLVLLALTGVVLAFMGQSWWIDNSWGIYLRSVHLWSVQAFIAVLLLHILVGVTTSGYRAPRRMVWVFGATLFCLALIQTEFGYGLRGDFASQFRATSGADFWNGAYLGYWLNPLNYSQAFALHVAIIPLAILLLFLAHYILERTYGIAKPYRADIKYTMVDANHTVMYLRGIALTILIAVLAFLFPSPYVAPLRIADVARQHPDAVAAALMREYERTSDTATYLDSIDPYTFDTRQVYITVPYEEYVASSNVPVLATSDPAAMIAALMPMVKSGLYESILAQEDPGSNDTYTLRFLSDITLDDTSAMEAQASTLNMSTEQWGMAKDVNGHLFEAPPGSWWFLPLALVNSAFDLPNNDNGDRIAAEILGGMMLLFILFPYIPFVNRLPEYLHLAPFIWRERTPR